MSSDTREPALDETSDEVQARSWRDAVRERALWRRDHDRTRSSRLRRWSWFLVVVLHLVLVASLRILLRADDNRVSETLMRVNLVDAPFPEPDLPKPMPAPRTRVAHRALRSAEKDKAKPDGIIANDASAQSPPLRVFSVDGSAVVARPPAGFHAPPGVRQYAWDSIMYRNHNPLHCRRRDRDLQAFENAGDVIARNPILRLLGLGNPNRARLAAEREATAAEVCDEP